MKSIRISPLLIVLSLSACGDSGWSNWSSASVPPRIQAAYVRFAGEPRRLGPKKVIVASSRVTYKMYVEEDNEWRTTSSKVCGGSSNRDGKQYFVWLGFVGKCNGNRYLKIEENNGRGFNIKEYVVITQTAGANNDGRLNWQGVYRKRH